MQTRVHLMGGGEGQSGYTKMDGQNTVHGERIYLLRSSLFCALSLTAVMYGLVVYYIVSNAQLDYAGKEFKTLAAQAGKDIRKSFSHSTSVCGFCR
jgi:hypothetical protein